MIAALSPVIDRWMVLRTIGERGSSVQHLSQRLSEAGLCAERGFETPEAAVQGLQSCVGAADRIVVFGGFDIVSRVYPLVDRRIAGACDAHEI